MSRKRLSESEFVLLITSHQAAIYAYVLTLLPDRVAAQDVLQETNLVLCRKRDEFEPGTHLKDNAQPALMCQPESELQKPTLI